jgi:L-ascorbate metabolism protein UlaG (beta-lactamase superfamily)
MEQQNIEFTWLGQGGARFRHENTVIYIDPYLSNSVQELDAPDLARQTPIEVTPESVKDADFVLITHSHIDHCDPHTIPIIAEHSPQAKFIGPEPIIRILKHWGIPSNRVIETKDSWIGINESISIFPTPAAHPEITTNNKGYYQQIGFILKFGKCIIYLAGDTFLCDELIDTLKSLPKIDTAILPVNEHNYYRNKRGITGNMSVRDAMGLAVELGVNKIIPVHWDMFSVNSTYPDEIRLLHKHLASEITLLMPTPFQTNTF